MRIGIDLLWVRVGKCGGTESYIRNLLDGFAAFDTINQYVLFTAKDHADSFRKYEKNPRMHIQVCRVQSQHPVNRVLWENRYLDEAAVRCKTDMMFIPVYSKPRSRSGIPYVSVIHDLQALHYPQYFSVIKRLFLKYAWKHTISTSDKVVAVSKYGRRDLVLHYPLAKEKVITIYIPIITRQADLPPEAVERKYQIKRKEYFYCVSSMLPHKNLDTLLLVMRDFKNGEEPVGMKLVISGVGGQEEKLRCRLKEYGIADRVVLTGYVSDEERNCLYENCRLFLFPSVFEGFGMPPIEAMRMGKRVVMTKKTCLEEVTRSQAVYVEHPFSKDEWKEKIQYAMNLKEEKISFERYGLYEIIQQYLTVFADLGPKPEVDNKMLVYEKIYDAVANNYQKANMRFEYEKTTYLCGIREHPQVIDLAGFTGLDNPGFYQAVFQAVYKRLPGKKEYEKWRGSFDMKIPEFQKKLLKEISASSFVAINHIRLKNNPYFHQRRNVKSRMTGVLYGLTDKPSLRKLGKRMPQPVQTMIKKVLL